MKMKSKPLPSSNRAKALDFPLSILKFSPIKAVFFMKLLMILKSSENLAAFERGKIVLVFIIRPWIQAIQFDVGPCNRIPYRQR